MAKHRSSALVARLPPGAAQDPETERQAADFVRGVVAALGGPERITAPQAALIATARATFASILAVERALGRQQGADAASTARAARSLPALSNSLRHVLATLGLDADRKKEPPRRPRNVREIVEMQEKGEL